MARDIFYYGTTKKLIVGFASIFEEVHYIDGHNQNILVPIHYSPKEKFVEAIQANPDFDNTTFDITLPQMGFEITSMKFAADRHLNPLSKIHDVNSSNEEFMFNRVPYDYSISLYVATRRFEDSLKIIEQIVPFFTPELTITLRDKEDFSVESNIPIVLNDVSFNVDYEGSFSTKRTITWTLDFTAKSYLYSNARALSRIKESIINLTNDDFESQFMKYTAEVSPRSANASDPHTIVETTEQVTSYE